MLSLWCTTHWIVKTQKEKNKQLLHQATACTNKAKAKRSLSTYWSHCKQYILSKNICRGLFSSYLFLIIFLLENKWKRNKETETVNKDREEVIITMIEGTERGDKYSMSRREHWLDLALAMSLLITSSSSNCTTHTDHGYAVRTYGVMLKYHTHADQLQCLSVIWPWQPDKC